MLKVVKRSDESFWIDGKDGVPPLAGIRVQVRPISVAMMLAAREQARAVMLTRRQVLEADASEGFDADTAIPLHISGNIAFTQVMSKWGIVSWEGVVGDKNEPLPVTPENIDLALTQTPFFDFVDRMYIAPALLLDAEKNASAPSQRGTGGAKTRAKRTAATVRRRARNAPTA